MQHLRKSHLLRNAITCALPHILRGEPKYHHVLMSRQVVSPVGLFFVFFFSLTCIVATLIHNILFVLLNLRFLMIFTNIQENLDAQVCFTFLHFHFYYSIMRLIHKNLEILNVFFNNKKHVTHTQPRNSRT